MHIKTDNFYKDISVDVDKWFDTSNYHKNDNRPLEIGKNKKVLGKFKYELGGKIMTKVCVLRAKTHTFLIHNYTDEDYEKNRIVNKKAKGTKKCVVKREILFNNYLDSLFKNKIFYRSQQRFRSDYHKVYTEEVNKIALSSNDDKRIQTFDKVTTYSYGTKVFMVCRNEMILKNKFIDSKSQSIRDKSEVLKKESQALRNNSLLLRNELKELRAASRNIKNKSYILRTESQILRNKSNESQSLRDKSQVLRKESQSLRTNSLLLRNELKQLRAASHDIKNKSYILRTESQMLRNKSNELQSLRDKSQVLRKESQSLTTNSLLLRNELKELRAASRDIKNKSYILRTESQILRNKSAKNEIEKELKVIREESLQIIDRSQNSRKSDNDNKPCDNEPYDNDKSKLQVIINVIDENKGINKKHTAKN